MPRRVIVTRPAAEAVKWVHALDSEGWDALALPLITIAPLHDRTLLDAARQRVGEYDALMFVSAAAAGHFLRESEVDAAVRCRFWATGPGTTRALCEAGVPGSSIDAPASDAAQFDSEALWQLVRGQVQPGTRVLIVRGGDASGQATGRDWLAREITEAGGICEGVAAYRRVSPSFSDDERRLAAEAATGSAIWLFSSSEAITNLQRMTPGIAWHDASAIATHERVADAARAAGFGRVIVSSPSLAALIASIESCA